MTRRRSKRFDDRGSVLLFAVALMLTVLAALTTLTVLAIHTGTTSGTFRDRTSAIGAAEGQTDVMVSKISAALTAAPTAPTWPCAPVAGTITDSGPEPITTTTTVTYYDANGTNVGCPASGTLVRSATVRTVATGPSVADALPVRRVLEALLTFTGGDVNTVPMMALPRSMFSQKDVAFNNTVSVTQTAGSGLASLYTNGNFSCANNTGLTGDLVAQGTVSMANSCTVGGNLSAGGPVNLTSSQAKVGNNVVAVGNVSVTGGNSAVGGTIRTAGLASWSGCTGSRCTSSDSTVTAPPQETLPTLPWDSTIETTWVNAGWTVVKFENPSDCTLVGGTNAPGQWLLNNASVAGPKTVVRTTCPIQIGSNSTINLARDLAFVADGGISLNNTMRFQAAAAQSLYFIQPTNAVAPGCTTNGISMNNNVQFQSTVSLMLFTPCNIAAAQSLNVVGQVYAGGGLNFNNSVSLTFKPMLMPIPTQTSTVINPYAVQVTTKRENQ